MYSIVVYSKPACVMCDTTKRALNKAGLVAGIDYEVVDMSEDPKALEFVRGLGYQQAPVVFAGDEHWSGFNPAKVKAAAAAYLASGAQAGGELVAA